MAKIPVSKYPNQAGYMQFDTNNNRVEVFSDGKFGPVGAVPFDHDINIYVGPGGDFDNPDDALDYIQYLQPKHFHFTRFLETESRTNSLYQNPQINLIFKTGYVFENPFIIENKFMPWLNITQEDLNTPLIVTLSNQTTPAPAEINAITIYSSRIRSFSLNLLNQSSHSYVNGVVAIHGSFVQYIPYIKLDHFQCGITGQTSTLYRMHEYHITNCKDYAFYISGFSFITFVTEPYQTFTSSCSNADSKALAAFCAYEGGFIHFYNGTHNIDNCTSALYAGNSGRIYIHANVNINVSNTTNVVRIWGGGMLHADKSIKKGVNVTNDIYPTDLIVNTFDPRGWVTTTKPSLTMSI